MGEGNPALPAEPQTEKERKSRGRNDEQVAG